MSFMKAATIILPVAICAACGDRGAATTPPPAASAAPSPSAPQARLENYELQEHCAKDAAAWYKHFWEDPKSDPDTVSNYTNHYNSKSGRCMLIVSSTAFAKNVTVTMKTLVDVLENRDMATLDRVSSRPQPVQCEVNGVHCASSEEWDGLTKPYMEQ